MLVVAAMAAVGCAPSIKPEGTGGGGAGTPTPQGAITTTDNGDGTFTTTVDATSEENYRYFDFETQADVEVEKPLNSTKWDLGFRRHLIPSNGGISGPGGVLVAVLEDVDFDAIEDAPVLGYQQDAEDLAEDGDDDPDFVFNAVATSWFAYNVDNHTLSPSGRVYIVRTVEGKHYKVKFEDYYDRAGTGGFPTFSWVRWDRRRPRTVFLSMPRARCT